jgi:hypothetical protein
MLCVKIYISNVRFTGEVLYEQEVRPTVLATSVPPDELTKVSAAAPPFLDGFSVVLRMTNGIHFV